MLSKLKSAGHYTLAKRMTSILRHVAGAFLPASATCQYTFMPHFPLFINFGGSLLD